ncbi:MAG: MBOAT family protein, partial [Chitinivibrionia bacterium]|nr:MBOAT family protein [Chitinivibrionia bacterium]
GGGGGELLFDLSVAAVWLAAICYTIQIYFDFSGYSDMAIGIGRMFGFHFPENFNYPYISKSITEFWRRWHISLSSFFRDYVYIPLGGNRVSKRRLLFNLFVVWTLTGVWHGANWTFLAWGFFYFVLLAAEKFTGFNKRFGFFGHFYAMLFVIIGWVLFRSESILQAGCYLRVMFGFGANPLTDEAFFHYFNACKIILFAGILFSLPVYPFIKNKLLAKPKLYEILSSLRIAVLFVITIAVCVRSTYNPFIYFNF